MRRRIIIEDMFRGNQAVKLEGKTFNKLTASAYLGRAFYRGQMQAVYDFKCECGNFIVTYAKEVKEGRTKHCGCIKPLVHKTKGDNGKDSRHKMWCQFWGGKNEK